MTHPWLTTPEPRIWIAAGLPLGWIAAELINAFF